MRNMNIYEPQSVKISLNDEIVKKLITHLIYEVLRSHPASSIVQGWVQKPNYRIWRILLRKYALVLSKIYLDERTSAKVNIKH